jgi:hypothetical protein
MLRARACAASAVLGLCPLATAATVNVFLDEPHQGKGNKGAEFRPVDEFGSLAGFLLTARSMIDASKPLDLLAPGSTGTVYIEKGVLGAGVQTAEPNGSAGISGGGGHQDEELIITFDAPTAAASLLIGLNAFAPGNGWLDGDDPVLFIDVAGQSSPVMLQEAGFLSAFTWTGSGSGLVDFGLLGLGPSAMIESVRVREARSHIFVNLITLGGPATAIPLPAPLALGIAGLGAVAAVRRRRAAAR